MKDLPYFKFYPNEWIAGDVQMVSFEAQGLFISLCALYWSKECEMTITKAKKRFRGSDELFKELIEDEIINLEDDQIIISFLDEQLAEREQLSKRNAQNGKKGGRPKKKPTRNPEETQKKPTALFLESETKAKKSNIEERREEERREEDIFNKKMELETELLNSHTFQEQAFRQLTALGVQTDLTELIGLIPVFCGKLEIENDLNKTLAQQRGHFVNWAKIELRNKNKNKNGKQTAKQKTANSYGQTFNDLRKADWSDLANNE